MKKAFALTLTATLLAACSGTWHGVKSDTTQSAVKKGGNAVGRGISHVGEKIENATE